MIILITAEKTRHFLALIEDISGHFTASIRLKGERLDAFHQDQEHSNMPTPDSSNYHCFAGSLGGDENTL